MEIIKTYLRQPKYAALAAFLAGLLIGWFVIGYWLWPVQWVDADLVDLRADVQERTMYQVIESYAFNGNDEAALASWSAFGEDAVTVYAAVKQSGKIPAENLAYFESLISAAGQAVPIVETGDPVVTEGEPVAGEEEPVAAEEQPALPVVPQVEPEQPRNRLTSIIGFILGFLVILLLGGMGVVAYFLFFKSKKTGQTKRQSSAPAANARRGRVSPVAAVASDDDEFEEEDFLPQTAVAGGATKPAGRFTKKFVTEYVYGNDLYDDTFSIDAGSGEFLGEFGVGISDTLGNTEPRNVTAFEVWLFDKNDVQTVTKVLMSEYAMRDPAILQRLEVKGEPVQIRPDSVVSLETATLRLDARILDVAYGRASQPENSFIQQMQVELTITSQQPF